MEASRGLGLELAPFRGLRYTAADPRPLLESAVPDLARALAPPYDVVDAVTAERLLRAGPLSALRLTVPPAAAESGSAYFAESAGQDRYARAARTLRRWRESGVLTHDREPALYVYEQALPGGEVQRGLIGLLRLPEAGSAAVLPHEEVHGTAVADRSRLMAATRANLEPVFLVYPGGSGRATARAVEEAASGGLPAAADTVTGDGVRHRLFALRDPALHADIAADLADRSALIADGHHRYAAYQRLRAQAGPDGGWDHGLVYLVDSDAYPPRLEAIHRVLPNVTAAAVRRAGSAAQVDALPSGDGTGTDAAGLRAQRLLREAAQEGPALLVADSREWHLLHRFRPSALAAAMPNRSTVWRNLPTAVLQHLLHPLWESSDESARLVHDDAAAALAAARTGAGAAVLVPAPTAAQVYEVAGRGELAPRKSTSFGPKPRTGMVLRTVD